MRSAFFSLHLSKVLRLPRKSDAKSYEVLHLSRKIILANLTIRCSPMQRLSGNQRPDLRTALMNMSLVRPLRVPRETTFERPKKARGCGVFNILTSKCASQIFAQQQCALFRHLNFQKCSETVSFFTLLSSKRASRHNSVQF